MSYQQRYAFTSKHVLQPIVDSELNLTVENLRVVEDNLHKEASRLQPISSTNMKERIMVVRREEIKKQLEELRIEMEQSKSKSMWLFFY
jgi:ribosomal protein L24